MMPWTLSSAVSASSTSIVTLPSRSLVLHTPQIPARQEKSIGTPADSAISRTLLSGGRAATLFDFENRIEAVAGPIAGAPVVTVVAAALPPLMEETSVTPGGGTAPNAGPKASVLTCSAGTPRSASSFLIACIMPGGPHR